MQILPAVGVHVTPRDAKGGGNVTLDNACCRSFNRSVDRYGRAQQMESASESEIGTFFGLSRFSADGDGATLSDTDVSLGAGMGYRWRMGSGLVVRAEGGYRRWFDDFGTNEFSLLLGLGASVGD